MKYYQTYTIIALIALTAVLSSCENYLLSGIIGEGAQIETLVYIDDFEKLTNTIDADVFLTQGENQQVKIVAQQNILDNLNLEVRNNRWTIEHIDRVRDHKGIDIYITIPEIKTIKLSGSGDVETEDNFINLRDIDLTLTGSGHLYFRGEMRDINAEITGSGNLTMNGEADRLDLKISGSGDFLGYKISLESADIVQTGSGFSEVYVADKLVVNISGSGNVYYRGNPQLESKITGSGRLIDDN